MAALGSSSSSSDPCVHIPDESPAIITVPDEKRWRPPPLAAAGLGLLAALVADRASAAYLRVAEPERTRARCITMAATIGLFCNGRACNTLSCVAHGAMFRVDEALRSCNRCGGAMNGKLIYMYRSSGFCTLKCWARSYYSEEYRFVNRPLILRPGILRRTPRVSAAMAAKKKQGLAALVGETSDRRIFFVCDDSY